mmetsp:Transcript_905/g.1806  ORF Transcript_905/g.1806 Transcript_905/m.1806 type:complete len:739 (-) Transcript_905:2591-4807(-)
MGRFYLLSASILMLTWFFIGQGTTLRTTQEEGGSGVGVRKQRNSCHHELVHQFSENQEEKVLAADLGLAGGLSSSALLNYKSFSLPLSALVLASPTDVFRLLRFYERVIIVGFLPQSEVDAQMLPLIHKSIESIKTSDVFINGRERTWNITALSENAQTSSHSLSLLPFAAVQVDGALFGHFLSHLFGCTSFPCLRQLVRQSVLSTALGRTTIPLRQQLKEAKAVLPVDFEEAQPVASIFQSLFGSFTSKYQKQAPTMRMSLRYSCSIHYVTSSAEIKVDKKESCIIYVVAPTIGAHDALLSLKHRGKRMELFGIAMAVSEPYEVSQSLKRGSSIEDSLGGRTMGISALSLLALLDSLSALTMAKTDAQAVLLLCSTNQPYFDLWNLEVKPVPFVRLRHQEPTFEVPSMERFYAQEKMRSPNIAIAGGVGELEEGPFGFLRVVNFPSATCSAISALSLPYFLHILRSVLNVPILPTGRLDPVSVCPARNMALFSRGLELLGDGDLSGVDSLGMVAALLPSSSPSKAIIEDAVRNFGRSTSTPKVVSDLVESATRKASQFNAYASCFRSDSRRAFARKYEAKLDGDGHSVLPSTSLMAETMEIHASMTQSLLPGEGVSFLTALSLPIALSRGKRSLIFLCNGVVSPECTTASLEFVSACSVLQMSSRFGGSGRAKQGTRVGARKKRMIAESLSLLSQQDSWYTSSEMLGFLKNHSSNFLASPSIENQYTTVERLGEFHH